MLRSALLVWVVLGLAVMAESAWPAAELETAAVSYANALVAGNLKQAWDLLSSGSQAGISAVQWQETFERRAPARKPPVQALLRALASSPIPPTVGEVAITEGEALVEVRASVPVTQKLVLVKEEAGWKVDIKESDRLNSRQAARDFLDAVKEEAETSTSGPTARLGPQIGMATLRALLASEARNHRLTSAEVTGDRAEVVLTAEVPVNLVLRATRTGPGWMVDFSRPLVPVDMASPAPLEEAIALDARTRCEEQLRQIARAIQMYAASSDDMLPDPERWVDQIRPYLPQPDPLHCPNDKVAGLSYAMNKNLAGKKLHQIANPSLTVLVYESILHQPNANDTGQGWPREPRHMGGNLVAFCDGSVRPVAAKVPFEVKEGPATGTRPAGGARPQVSRPPVRPPAQPQRPR